MPNESLLRQLRGDARELGDDIRRQQALYDEEKRQYEAFVSAFDEVKRATIYPALKGISSIYKTEGVGSQILESGDAGTHSVRLVMPKGRWIEFGMNTSKGAVYVQRQMLAPPIALRDISRQPRPEKVAELSLAETTPEAVDVLLGDFVSAYFTAVRQPQVD